LAVLRLTTSSNLVGCWDRQVGGLRPLQDLSGVYSRLAPGIREADSAHNSFGGVVIMLKLRIRSPADERQVSHNPAMPISRRSVSAIA
jgi:hypothetical protein